jgi:hypothetical protein
VSIRVVNQSIVQKSFFIYQLLCFLYLHIIYSIDTGQSALSLPLLGEHARGELVLLGVGFLSLLLTYFSSKLSRHAFLIFFLVLLWKSMVTLLDDLNKVILILNFCLTVFSYYFYQVWWRDLGESAHNPCFSPNSVDSANLYGLSAELIDGNKNKYSGHLTNWNRDSAFVVLDEGEEFPDKAKEIIIKYEGREFSGKIRVVSKGKNWGLGFKFVRPTAASGSDYSWDNLFEILGDRGLKPIYR